MNTITIEMTEDYCTPDDLAFACKLARQARAKVMMVKRLCQLTPANPHPTSVPMQPRPMLIGVVQANPESQDAEVIYARTPQNHFTLPLAEMPIAAF